MQFAVFALWRGRPGSPYSDPGAASAFLGASGSSFQPFSMRLTSVAQQDRSAALHQKPSNNHISHSHMYTHSRKPCLHVRLRSSAETLNVPHL